MAKPTLSNRPGFNPLAFAIVVVMVLSVYAIYRATRAGDSGQSANPYTCPVANDSHPQLLPGNRLSSEGNDTFRGDECVRHLQWYLTRLGYEVGFPGIYGGVTLESVIEFQKSSRCNCPPNGEVKARTWQALHQSTAGDPPVVPPPGGGTTAPPQPTPPPPASGGRTGQPVTVQTPPATATKPAPATTAKPTAQSAPTTSATKPSSPATPAPVTTSATEGDKLKRKPLATASNQTQRKQIAGYSNQAPWPVAVAVTAGLAAWLIFLFRRLRRNWLRFGPSK